MEVDAIDIFLDFLSPIESAFEDVDSFSNFLCQSGINLNLELDDFVSIKKISLVRDLEDLSSAISVISFGSISESSIKSVADKFQKFSNSVQTFNVGELSEVLDVSLPAPFDSPKGIASLGEKILGYLLSSWIRRNNKQIYYGFCFVGIIDEIKHSPIDIPQSQINWDNLFKFCSNPISQITSKYNWGGAFRYVEFTDNILNLLSAFGLFPRLSTPPGSIYSKYIGLRSHDLLKGYGVDIVNYSNTSTVFDSTVDLLMRLKFGLYLFPSPKAPNGDISGLALTNIFEGALASKFDLGNSWSLNLESETDLNGVLGLNFQPDGVFFEQKGFDVNFGATLSKSFEEPKILLGEKDETRLEISGLSFHVEADISDTDQELIAAFILGNDKAKGFKLVIKPKEDDFLLKQIIGEKPKEITIDPSIYYSTKKGFSLPGLADNTLVLPVSLKFGPIEVNELVLSLKAADSEIQLKALVSMSANFELLSFAADRMGLSVSAKKLPENDYSGLLGNLDLNFNFVPPQAMGLVFTKPEILSGGAYLDLKDNEYSGIGEVNFKGIGFGAIGILNTKIDGKPDAWSLYLNMYGIFPKILLGYGFFLKGAGGLFCIHRTLSEDELRKKLEQGALDSIMFPVEPVKNVNKILSDIKTVFPIKQDTYIVGIMFKIVWGEPELLEINLALAMELPALRPFLLGQLQARLPDKVTPIVFLNLDVFGTGNFNEGTMSLDAVLRNSYVLDVLKLSGSMAFRARFKGQPLFLMGIGGFHHDFKPPENFPKLNLITAAIEVGEIAKVSVSCYMALSSNTVQFGARVDVMADLVVASLVGYGQIDTLIQLFPFQFTVSAVIGAKITADVPVIGPIVLTLDVLAQITGPSPIIISGLVKASAFGIEINYPLLLRAGSDVSSKAPDNVDLKLEIENALKTKQNWKSIESLNSISNLKLDARDGVLLPSSRLEFKQKFAPIDTQIDCVGAASLGDYKKIELESVKIATKDPVTISADNFVTEWFAPAHYYKIQNEEEKIKAPSFQELNAGFLHSVDDLLIEENNCNVNIEHEESYIDIDLNHTMKRTSGSLGADSDKIKSFRKKMFEKKKRPKPIPREKQKTEKYAIVAATSEVTDIDKKSAISSYFEAKRRVGAINSSTSKQSEKVKLEKVFA